MITKSLHLCLNITQAVLYIAYLPFLIKKQAIPHTNLAFLVSFFGSFSTLFYKTLEKCKTENSNFENGN